MPGVLDAASKYLVHQLLGQGGMGIVHLGTMVGPAGTRKVAIKQVLRKEDADPERIVREAQLVFQLTHANICQVLDLAQSDEGTFIVMEFVDGCDLKTLLSRAPLPGAAAAYVARAVAEALDYAHRKKDVDGRALCLVHGDVTPQNILLSREGEVKLADFGIARAYAGEGPGNQMFAGTPGFIAPEVRQGQVDQRSDLYSLGKTLAAALGGDVDSAIAEIIERATQSRPGDRYASAAEMRQALARYLVQHHPSFSSVELSQIVQAHAEAPPLANAEDHGTLVSLTGTATFFAPAEQADLSRPLGTRPVAAEKSSARKWPIPVALVTIMLSAFVFWPRAPKPIGSPPAAVPVHEAAPAHESPPAHEVAVHEVTSAPLPHEPDPPANSPPKPVKHARHVIPLQKHEQKLAAEGMGYLTVNAEPWGAVVIDGRQFAHHTPLYRAPLSAGKHSVTVFNPVRNASAPGRTVVIEPGKTLVIGFDW